MTVMGVIVIAFKWSSSNDLKKSKLICASRRADLLFFLRERNERVVEVVAKIDQNRNNENPIKDTPQFLFGIPFRRFPNHSPHCLAKGQAETYCHSRYKQIRTTHTKSFHGCGVWTRTRGTGQRNRNVTDYTTPPSLIKFFRQPKVMVKLFNAKHPYQNSRTYNNNADQGDHCPAEQTGKHGNHLLL